jgi:hypothetical protein
MVSFDDFNTRPSFCRIFLSPEIPGATHGVHWKAHGPCRRIASAAFGKRRILVEASNGAGMIVSGKPNIAL